MPEAPDTRGLLEGRRWGWALVAASMTAWAVISITILGPAHVQSASGSDALWNQILLFAFFGIPAAFVVCFLGGVPVLLLADWLKLRRWWHAIFLGAAAGLAFGVFWPRNLAFLLVFAVAGMAAGFAAWLVVRGERISA